MRSIDHLLSETLVLGDGRVVTLLESLGRGSLGEVHRGVLESGWGVCRPVAVRLFDPVTDQHAGDLMETLARAVRRAVTISHPSVIATFEVDRAEGQGVVHPLVLMELVQGESLASLLDTWRERSLRVPVDFALVAALKIAEGLGAALSAEMPDGTLTSLVHGDLSPNQVLVSTQGEVKVGDFGHAFLRHASSHVRSRYAIAYTAPEVACGSLPDARSDVFSLGVILREMLIGPRFAARTPTEDVIVMVKSGRVHEHWSEPNLPRELRGVIDRALEVSPSDRFPHPRALAFDLRREMLRMGLCDAATCVRQAAVGWCDLQPSSERPVAAFSDVAPRPSNDDTVPEIRRAKLR